MQTFNLRALEFAKSHLEDIKQPDTTKSQFNMYRIVELHDIYHKTFLEIALIMKSSKTHMYYLYKKAKQEMKKRKRTHT